MKQFNQLEIKIIRSALAVSIIQTQIGINSFHEAIEEGTEANDIANNLELDYSLYTVYLYKALLKDIDQDLDADETSHTFDIDDFKYMDHEIIENMEEFARKYKREVFKDADK